MKTLTRCLFAAVLALIVNNTASAQFPSSPFVPVPNPSPELIQQLSFGVQRPSVPVIVTPNVISGVNVNGGFNTKNEQINNTAFDRFRNESINNGTLTQVNRPVYNQFGQVVGFEQGYEWKNSITGQTHGKTKVITNNDVGGHHELEVVKSAAPADLVPQGAAPQQSLPIPVGGPNGR